MSGKIAVYENALGAEEGAWHEYNLEIATEVLAEFSPNDWQSLQAIVLLRPAYWQERCAESIGSLESDEGIPILIALLDSPHFPVAAIVASELDNLLVKLPANYERTLQKLLAYLDENSSPRSADVRRLLGNLQ
jgi:hypothetical protein